MFRAFVDRRGESHDWIHVESTRPPEPDLLCTHRQFGPIAFELVAITDTELAKLAARPASSDQHAVWTSDPTERIIRKKLGRTYQTIHPLELLVHHEMLVVTPDDIVLEVAIAWLSSKEHPFRRAWFMGEECTCEFWTRDA